MEQVSEHGFSADLNGERVRLHPFLVAIQVDSKERKTYFGLKSDRSEFICGVHMWGSHVGFTCGVHMWGTHVGSICGVHMWDPYVYTYNPNPCTFVYLRQVMCYLSF